MSAPLPLLPQGFDELSVDEQIAYAQSLWDRIAAGVDHVPLADWQRELLEQRLAAHRAAPHEARPWEAALERLERRLRPRSDPPN
jgi:putative addiction module component (TIGR02574 family)